ncbi:MAG: glycoside hydrolase, partial [Gemmatimonadota bacterium]|nr:glycoside hydrolase [Gemmatimonadota bacterium]
DDGDHWRVISPDLSAKRPGDTANCRDADLAQARACGFGVIYAIAPSPVSRSVIWVGTDDGLIRRTADGGKHWANVTPPDVPAWATIDNIDPSAFDAATAYAAVDLHRLDRETPLILKTTDAGRHWQAITNGIPADEFVMVVRADPVKRGLLYAGTNRGVYVSFDDGARWQPLSLNLPTTWYRDLLVHDGDLIAATQGRGIWILDDVEPLREAAAAAQSAEHLYAPLVATRLRGNENRDTPWPPGTPVAQNPPTGAVIDYWLAADASGPVTLTVRDASGRVIRRFSSADSAKRLPASQYFENGWLGTPPRVDASAGMHRFVWDLRYPRPDALSYDYSIAGVWHEGTPVDPRGPLALPGRYTISLTANGTTETRPLTVRMDPRVRVPAPALRAQLALALAVDSALGRATAAHRKVADYLATHGGSLSRAMADSARAVADGLASADGVLASLATAVVAADAEPTQGERGVLAEAQHQVDGLLKQWATVLRAAGGG